MKVIKAVRETSDGELVSTYAIDQWIKVYAKGIETKPDIGYLFAYPVKDLERARMAMSVFDRLWIAEAEVVGKIQFNELGPGYWEDFWRQLKRRRRYKGFAYLLCSSITLVEEIKTNDD